MSSTSSERPGVSLTTTALCIGVPVLVGASCYYLYHANKNCGKGDSVKPDATKKRTLSPKEHLAQLKQTGNHNFSRKNYDIAIENYTKAIDLSTNLSDYDIQPHELAIFYQNRAACNEALGHFEKVVTDCDQAISLSKSYVKAYVRRARAFEKLEKFDKAMVDAFSANLLEKFQNQANMILTENIVKTSSKIKAAESMKTHKPTWPANQVIKGYFSAFTQDPIREKIGDNITNGDQLQSVFDEAIRQENDEDPLSLLIRGTCFSLMNDMKAAQAALDKLLDFDDEICSAKLKANALIKKAAVVISEPSSASSTIEKDIENVHELLDQAIILDPTNPDTYLHKSQALALSEKLEEAIESLNKAIEINPDFHSAIAQKFYVEFKLATKDPLFSSPKLQDLLDKFKSAIKENPKALDLHQMYAQVLTELNYFELADQVLIDQSKLDPTDGNIYLSRALLQFHMKNDSDEVVNLLKEALKIDPKIIFAYEILGSIESQRGKFDEAIKIFESALNYAQTESEFARCYGLLDSALSQKVAAERLGVHMMVN